VSCCNSSLGELTPRELRDLLRLTGRDTQHVGADGIGWPKIVWVVCPDSPEPWYVAGTDQNWNAAIGFAGMRGCKFTGSKTILHSAPDSGWWVDIHGTPAPTPAV
jgi:hypothetical protein